MTEGLSRIIICINRATFFIEFSTKFADFNGTIGKHNAYSQNYETKTQK